MYSSFLILFTMVYSCINAKPAWWSNAVSEISDNEPVHRQLFYPGDSYQIETNPQNGNIIFYDREVLHRLWPLLNTIESQESDDLDNIFFGPRTSSTTKKTPIIKDEGSDNILFPSQDEFTTRATPDWITTTVSFINQSPDLPAGTVTDCQRKCMLFVTSEYNPYCGSDGVTYSNPGKVICAQRCGKDIKTKSGTCGVSSPQV